MWVLYSMVLIIVHCMTWLFLHSIKVDYMGVHQQKVPQRAPGNIRLALLEDILVVI